MYLQYHSTNFTAFFELLNCSVLRQQQIIAAIMRNYSREPQKTYLKSVSPARPLSLPKPAEKVVKANEVLVGRYKYNSDEILGKGFTSRVYKGVEVDNIYKRYAIKVIELKKFRGSSLEMLEAQIDIHRHLVHENVLRLYEIIKTPYFYYLILEYCPHGNLHEYIRQKKRLTEVNAIEIMTQILDGYNYLSSQNVMHRDLKPANILRIGNKWKISDFGFAVKSKYGFKDRINVGTPLYMAPQTIFKTYYSSKTDIFSLGIILYQMVMGKTPWESSSQKQLKEKLKIQLVMPQSIKNIQVRQFIQKCCQLNETKRLSKDELLSYTFKGAQDTLDKLDKPSAIHSNGSGIRSKKQSNSENHPSPPGNPQEQQFKQNYQKLTLQFHFAQHLYTCVKNKDSFLFYGENIQIFLLTVFKFSLKVLRLLTDRKINHFQLKDWQNFNKSPQFESLQSLIYIQLEREEKEYLESIKHFDIKTVRSVNRKFPELCSTAPIGERFYEAVKAFILPLIREHNHQLMLLHIQNEQTKHKLGNIFGQGVVRLNHFIQAMDGLYTIYNIADLRTNNSAANQEISLSAMKVVQDFRNSPLIEEDYLDLRRLIRSF